MNHQLRKVSIESEPEKSEILAPIDQCGDIPDGQNTITMPVRSKSDRSIVHTHTRKKHMDFFQLQQYIKL